MPLTFSWEETRRRWWWEVGKWSLAIVLLPELNSECDLIWHNCPIRAFSILLSAAFSHGTMISWQVSADVRSPLLTLACSILFLDWKILMCRRGECSMSFFAPWMAKSYRVRSLVTELLSFNPMARISSTHKMKINVLSTSFACTGWKINLNVLCVEWWVDSLRCHIVCKVWPKEPASMERAREREKDFLSATAASFLFIKESLSLSLCFSLA